MLTNLVLENKPMVRKVHNLTFFLEQYFPNVVAYDLCCRLLWVNKPRKLYLHRAIPYCITHGERPPSYSPSFCVNRVAYHSIAWHDYVLNN